MTDVELERGIKSLDKQIQSHLDKIKNPKKEIAEFEIFDPRKQRNLIEEKWPEDIRRLKQQKEILEGIKNERN